jgi:hypothetical protein
MQKFSGKSYWKKKKYIFDPNILSCILFVSLIPPNISSVPRPILMSMMTGIAVTAPRVK